MNKRAAISFLYHLCVFVQVNSINIKLRVRTYGKRLTGKQRFIGPCFWKIIAC
jgi:hypothetical protein